jgi:hypothetical protein
MAKILLCRTTHLVEISDKNLNVNEDVFEEMVRQIENLIEDNFYLDGIFFKWISSNPVVLDTLIDNIGKCCNCGTWTTNSEGIDPVNDVSYGAYVNGQLFCDSCLPDGHHLKF